MARSIHARYSDNLLLGATATATPTPMATYSADTLLTLRPADRVRWAGGSPDEIRIHFDLSGSSPSDRQADLLVIPVWNVDAEGSPSIARLTSDTGMNVPIAVPEMPPSGIPRTTAVDLTLLETDTSKRTSDGFDLVITGNSVPLTMGGAVLLYGPKRAFLDRDWRYGFTRAQRNFSIVHENEYGTDLVAPLRTRQRSLQLSTLCPEAEALELEAWADDNFGDGLPGTIWPFPPLYEAYFGRLGAVHSQVVKKGGPGVYMEIALTFTEISKGKPL